MIVLLVGQAAPTNLHGVTTSMRVEECSVVSAYSRRERMRFCETFWESKHSLICLINSGSCASDSISTAAFWNCATNVSTIPISSKSARTSGSQLKVFFELIIGLTNV